ncbi:MAG: hypothetical protein DID92_2727745393 [Candidatus Nitrotoga sp. SPKER]|nr:MAG: hypothetical protein DID92_2727745393 [Candidatus Nitrotoga sp. SPKER]
MKTSKIILSLTGITMSLVGTLMSEMSFAAGSWSGGGHATGGRGGSGFSGGGHAGGSRVGGSGFSGGRVGVGRPGFSGGRYVGSGWNRSRSVGIYLGAPMGFRYGSYPYSYYGAPYYGSSYYYSPAPAYYPLVQPAPVTYIERSDEQQIATQEASTDLSQDVQESWWYYCVDAKAYYPYVNQCPGGWLRVAPQPATDPDPDGQPASD